MNHNISELRNEYTQSVLEESSVDTNPFKQFDKWLNEAIESRVNEPTAMCLSTAFKNGKPSSRTVLLKGFNNTGFTFFTNYQSKKGLQIKENPFGSLLFFWPKLERQIRIEGSISKASEEESDIYFDSRPRGSKIGAWISPQSREVISRIELERAYESFEKNRSEGTIKRPDFWGGYVLAPDMIEFWQGRQSRLHDRILYKKLKGSWKISRLAP